MRRLCVVVLLAAGSANAERGLFNLSLSSGQAVSVAPGPGATRGIPLVATFEYGLSERWSGALTAGVEFMALPTVTLALGPRVALFHSEWWTIEAVAVPELLWVVPRRLDLGLRVGVSVRYQIMWGVGLGLEASVRGRTDAFGPFNPSLQGLVIAGLFVEA